jgi:hypothetical protein
MPNSATQRIVDEKPGLFCMWFPLCSGDWQYP